MILKDQYNKTGSIYSQLGITGTGYLGFKYIPKLIKKYSIGNKTLDYGCGAGRSTRFLKALDLQVDGVDISPKMIELAVKADIGGYYQVIESAVVPKPSCSYDNVFSSYVLFEISSKSELTRVFSEVNRVLRMNGIFIAVTGSSEMYNHPWLSLKVDYPENRNLSSGSKAKILLKSVGLTLYDYFWTDEDYQQVIERTSFDVIKKIHPLGQEEDEFPWVTEKTISPYVIYVLKKK